jgi:hypothetical protein
MSIVRRVVVGWLAVSAASVLAALALRRLVPAFGGESDDVFSLVYAMSGGEFVSSATELRSGEVTAFMGGAQIDLRNAQIADRATLDLRAWMGGVDVIVPSTWRVEIASSVFMGGIANLTDPDGAGTSAPLLLVSAKAVMGGIEVHADPAATVLVPDEAA